jgi:hypothetical protein
MLTATDTRVISFYNFINSKPKNSDGYYIGSSQNSTSLLYVMGGNSPMIQVWLPIELIEYSNAAAGSSGDRAVGIRRSGYSSVKKAAEHILDIFSNPEKLAQFINTSECDYAQVHAERIAKRIALKTPKVPSAKEEFWNRYNKEVLTKLVVQYGRTVVQNAYNGLNIDEFEAQFNLSKELTTA